MSAVSRWTYTNVATVWPRGARDHLKGGSAWGEPYQIACTWTADDKIVTDQGDNSQFVPTCVYFHEDKRVKFGDMIAQGEHAEPNPTTVGARPIRSHTNWDMSFFNDPDPDFKSAC
ncbi:major tail protein [Pseudomonas phage DDSR119]|nr:major tail protein [Pseudomonas phage DDSR119]